MIRKIFLIAAVCVPAANGLTGCTLFGTPESQESQTVTADEMTSENTQNAEASTEASQKEETSSAQNDSDKKQETEVSLLAVGDNLIHDTIYEAFYEGDGVYDFHSLYDYVRPTVKEYDIAVINQETIFVEDDNDVENYPNFGTPHEMGEALYDTGFDVVLSATNHTMDKGADTIEYMYDYWKTKYPQVSILGIHGDEKDFNTIDYVEKNGIKLAMFNYTYGLNGYSLPDDRSYLVDLLDNKDKFISDLKKAEDEADMSVCFLHIGEEYTYEPTEFQKQYIEDIIDAGADLVICAHPHVVEPFGEVTTANGNKGTVFYSCGNFVSAQDEIDRLLGGMASVTIKKTTEGDRSVTEVTDFDFIPVVMHYSNWSTAVYKLEDYTDDLAGNHWVYYYDDRLSVDYLWELWEDITG